ncbi:autotransporter domain-containing protein [uncultured Pseudoteredinibacter sp.]|uniref:autotransporter family protein n=1 Tax=uncultured Pseudoteredinibacter sp. TaxID=1641701 RepID=UPI002637AECD|nr:autotransporter domain-containing protein [uncultured Pseudoteredinibacter sp.]
MCPLTKIQKGLYLLTAVMGSSLFCHSASASPFSVSASTNVSQPSSVIGSTLGLDVNIEDVTGSTPAGGNITVSLATTGGSGVNWTPDSSPCTPTGTTNEFTCTMPISTTASFSFISPEITSADNYTTTVALGSTDCIAGSGTPAAVCSRNVSFDIFTPTLTISLSGGGNSVAEGDSGNTTVTLDFTLDTLPAGSTILESTYEVVATNTAFASNPVASQGADYNFQSTPPFFTWNSGSSSLTQSVSIDIIGDTLAEGDESIYIVAGDIANITGAFTPSQPRFELQIIDDDSGPSFPEVSVIANNSIGEGDGPLVATVSVDQTPGSTASVDLISAPGTTPAASGDDFEQKTVTILFDGVNTSDYTFINSTTVQLNFGITDDSDVEGNENFDIFLSQASDLTISSTDGFQNISIIDNDAVATPPQINASSQRSFAENSGQASITFTRTGSTTGALSFDFATIDASPIIKSAATSSGIATAGADYTSTSTTVSWAAGEAGNKTVSIPIINDSLFEGDETFQALASNLTGSASFNFDPAMVLTIVEDDVEPGGEFNFSAASYDVNEDAGSATITVRRTGGSNGDVSVNYATSDDSASASSDYSSSAGTLNWASGDTTDKTFSVAINTDILNEPTEKVLLTLSSPAGSATLGSQANAVLNILNINEPGAPEISKEDISVTDFDGDGLVEVVLDATGKIVSDDPISDVNWIKDGDTIATGMTTSAKLPIGTHPLRVVAIDSNGKMAAVDFIAEVKELDPETTRMLSDTSGLNTEQGTVAGALDDLCPRLSELGQQNGLTTGQSNLRNRCEQLRDPDLDDAEIVDALDQIAGEEAEAIIITAARFTNMHQTNLRNRFTQLRRGGKTLIDVSGLNMRLDGGSLSGNMFAAVGRNLIGGGAASGDEAEPEIYSDSRLGLFMNGNISYGERDPTKNNSGFKLDIEGITAGMDYRFTDKFIGGIAIGYSSSDLDYANDGGILEGSSTFYSAYTSYYSDNNYYIDSSITYADSDFDVTRHIKYRDMSGLVDLRRGGSTNGEQLLATLDFGWDYNNGPWTFGPNGSFSYSDTSIDGYAEQGDSGLELQYSGQDNVTGTLGLGFHGSRVFLMDWGVLIANLNGNYYREFKNQNGIIRASFVHDPFRFDNTNPTQEMLIVSDIPDRNYFSLGLGLAAQFKYGLSGFIDYQSLLKADDIKSRELAFGLRYEAKF